MVGALGCSQGRSHRQPPSGADRLQAPREAGTSFWCDISRLLGTKPGKQAAHATLPKTSVSEASQLRDHGGKVRLSAPQPWCHVCMCGACATACISQPAGLPLSPWVMQEAGSWQEVLRALCALEAVVQQGSTAACGEIAVHFQVGQRRAGLERLAPSLVPDSSSGAHLMLPSQTMCIGAAYLPIKPPSGGVHSALTGPPCKHQAPLLFPAGRLPRAKDSIHDSKLHRKLLPHTCEGALQLCCVGMLKAHVMELSTITLLRLRCRPTPSLSARHSSLPRARSSSVPAACCS